MKFELLTIFVIEFDYMKVDELKSTYYPKC